MSITFESLKTLLCSAPVLTPPNLPWPIKLEVDASAVSAAGVLLQENADGAIIRCATFHVNSVNINLDIAPFKNNACFVVSSPALRGICGVQLSAYGGLHRPQSARVLVA